VCAIELPGHGRRLSEPPITQIEILIQRLSTSMQTWLDKPFIFFGHSLGALIAFELARSLRTHQRPGPELLWVSAARAPHLVPNTPPIHALPRPDFIVELRRYGGTPDAILENEELIELLLPSLRADFSLLETYRHQPQVPLSCPIRAFWGAQDEIVALADMKPWRIHTDQIFELERLEGTHFFIHQDQSLLLQRMATQLSQWRALST
jgi:medium-chain acyl-[acyl-carrier-protein] hydrolase